jgi:5-methylcytosine-specific restriction protein B
MTRDEITAAIFDGASHLLNRQLPYLTNRNAFTPTLVEDGRIRGVRGESDEISISRAMIENYARSLEGCSPVHLETALEGSGNERSALEALVSHLPHVGFITDGNVPQRTGKHVLWSNEAINTLGQRTDISEGWKQYTAPSPTALRSVFANTPISRALLSKPFLILTGPSGTGKTRGAIQLAESLCDEDCRAVVAVGADWTDNRHVVGFLNPLQTVDATPNGTPIYETTVILNLLLHANAEENRDKPHVLILDEMNLSHVERYFADFLSAMELLDKEKALKLHSAGRAKTREGEDVEGSIDFPENLFVIGTVNIDETTYMFSPKVLDRANVIEIHADPTALAKFLEGIGGEAGPEARDHGISFLDAAQAIRNEEEHVSVPPLPPAVRVLAAERLIEIFEIMKRGRGEFGFRTGREVLAYLRTAHFLTPEAERAAWSGSEGGWLKALDAQILQKILPKLHGSRTRLAPLLGALAQYCATGTKAYAMEHFPEGGNSPKRGLNDARNIQNPKFEESYKKLERMIQVLVEEQFVSFIC